MRLLLALALCGSAAPANAGLAFVQVVQAQTSQGEDGLFGKSWVEISGSKMRIVSGYARRVAASGEAEDPQRVIQLIDLGKKERLMLYPESKTYSRVPLGTIDYSDVLAAKLRRGAPDGKLKLLGLQLQKTPGVRTLLGAECEQYRLRAEMQVLLPQGRVLPARMDQDILLARVSGTLSRSFLDLISFENAYRAAAGGALSPLDHERYQVREAAAYLRVPPADLRGVIEQARERMRDLPGYPVAASVAWWKGGDSGSEPGPEKAPPPRIAPRRGLPAPAKPKKLRLRVIDWHRSERDINKMYDKTESQWGSFPFGPLRQKAPEEPAGGRGPARSVYPVFHDDVRKALISVLLAQQALAQRPADSQTPPPAHAPPFYQIYSQLHGLETTKAVPDRDLSLPADYVERKERK